MLYTTARMVSTPTRSKQMLLRSGWGFVLYRIHSGKLYTIQRGGYSFLSGMFYLS